MKTARTEGSEPRAAKTAKGKGRRRALLQMAVVAAASGGAALVGRQGVQASDGPSHFPNGIDVDGSSAFRGAVYFSSSVYLGGDTTTSGPLSVQAGATVYPILSVQTLSGGSRGLVVEQRSDDSAAPLFRTRKSRLGAFPGVYTPVRFNDALASLRFQGADAAGFPDGASIHVTAAEHWAQGKNGARMSFYTTPVGTAVPTERMRFDAVGNIGINSASPGKNVVLNAAPATNASSGFPYIPAMNGKPTGTPANIPGHSPIVHDTANNKLWVFSGDVWRGATLTLG